MLKNNCLTDLIGSQYLFEILQTTLTVKKGENGCFEKCLRWRVAFFFRNKVEI